MRTAVALVVGLLTAVVISLPSVYGSEWPTYHGSSGLLGYSKARLPDSLRILWRYRAPGSILTTPVSMGGRIYALAGGTVVALDREGKELWVQDLARAGGWRFEAPALAVGDLLVAGSPEGVLFALDGKNGAVRWEYDLGGPLQGAPNWVSGPEGDTVLAVSQKDGTLHAVSLSDGSRVYASERTNRCDGSLAVDGGLVVFGNCDAALYTFDAQSGKKTGKISLLKDGQVYSGVALADGTVYAGDRSGRLYAVDVRSGKILWVNEQAGGDLSSTPAVSPDTLVYGSDDGTFYAVGRGDGAPKWVLETAGRPLSPVIASGKVLAPSDGTIYLLDLGSGRVLRELELSDQISSPAVVGSIVLVGSQEGYLFALGNEARGAQKEDK